MQDVVQGGPNLCLSPHYRDEIPNLIGSHWDHVTVEGPCTAESWVKAKETMCQISLKLEKGDESVDVCRAVC